MSYRNGLTVTDNLLLHPTYNPSGSHSFATSPYTGEARGDGMQPNLLLRAAVDIVRIDGE